MVGGKNNIQVDVQVLSATNRDIEADVEGGEFRADLLSLKCHNTAYPAVAGEEGGSVRLS